MNNDPSDLMFISAARALAGVRLVFVGVGLPNVACNLARQTVAPDLELIYESGMVGSQPPTPPLSIGDPSLVYGALAALPMADLFGLILQRGLVEVALLGGAQVDPFGNLNTTVIGDYNTPTTRLPGSGGALEIAIHAQALLYMMKLSRRGFVERVDFVTSPGYLTGGDVRRVARLPGGGPRQVITDKAIFDFATPDHEMQLIALQPSVTVAEVQAAVGWPLRVAETLAEIVPPTAEELQFLRG